jgi:hypothetical protein
MRIGRTPGRVNIEPVQRHLLSAVWNNRSKCTRYVGGSASEAREGFAAVS